MSGWTFFFILVGVVFLTSQLFRVIDAIERPNRRHDRRRRRFGRLVRNTTAPNGLFNNK